ASSARFRAWLPRTPETTSGSSTFSTDERTGNRLYVWKTNPMLRARNDVRALSERLARFAPAMVIDPASTSSRPLAQFSNVVLPRPDGPMMASISPGWTSNDTPRSARTWLLPRAYVFTTESMVMIGAATGRSASRMGMVPTAATCLRAGRLKMDISKTPVWLLLCDLVNEKRTRHREGPWPGVRLPELS